jgi:hypothetical protein
VSPDDPLFALELVGMILTTVLVTLIVIFGLVIWWLRRKQGKISRKWQREGVTFLRGPAMVNVWGLESEGLAQIRGNGVMALTGQELRIARLVPAKEWHLPHHSITHVALEPSFLGKRRTKPVLVITFAKGGRTDRLGVYVRERQSWLEAIATAANLPHLRE